MVYYNHNWIGTGPNLSGLLKESQQIFEDKITSIQHDSIHTVVLLLELFSLIISKFWVLKPKNAVRNLTTWGLLGNKWRTEGELLTEAEWRAII